MVITTEIDKLRNRISDSYKYGEDSQAGDGSSKIYELSHAHVKSESLEVYIDDELKVEDTDYTVDLDSGVIIFEESPLSTEVVRATYKFSAFTDEELEYYLDESGDSIDGAALMALDVLLWDSARRFDYSTGKAEMKPRQVFQNLKDLRAILEKSVKGSGNELRRVKRKNSRYENESTEVIDLSRLENVDKVWSNNA